MTSSGDDTIQTAALGRPFQLGMLYDCRKDTLIPGITLWDQEQLQTNTSVQQRNNTELNVTTSDSIEEKSNSLKISGSLKLSLLGGLVNLGGSAKYFRDTKKSHKQARVTLQYQTTTKFETLTMSHLGCGKVSHLNVFEDNTPTHVVTAILYGAGAYFVFDRETSSDDNEKQVEGEANITYNKLKFLTVDTEASLNMDDKEKTALEKFSCTFYGDFQLPANPTSLSDAVRVYRELPKLLGENGEHAVPLRVWLYPLCKLDSRAARLQRNISNNLIKYSSDIIESLTKTEMRCNDLLKDTAAATFPAMKEKVQDLMCNCHHYKLDFMQKLGSVLPSIRAAGTEEGVLEDILKAHDESPFNNKDLDQWLTNKEKESETMKSFLRQLEKLGAKMENNMDDLLSDLDIQNIVSFSFTSVDQPDSFLMKLSNYLKPSGMVVVIAESSDLQTRNTRWLSTETRLIMRKQLKLFGELKKISDNSDTKFIIDSKHSASHPGACIFIYEGGSDDAVCFVPPSKPAVPTATAVSHNSIIVHVSDPDSATVEYQVQYREKQNQETEWKSHPVQKNEETVTLSGLRAGTDYEIRARAVGKLSYAVSSDVCSAVTLIVVGPPTQVTSTKEKANSVQLTWNLPSVQLCQSVKQYIIEFREMNQWQRKETGQEVYTFTLENLKQNTVYSIRMCTDAGVVVSEPGEEVQIQTKKEPVDVEKFTLLPGDPPIYLLKPSGDGHLSEKIFGSSSPTNPSNKTIMLVGATGSGKTTLINGMINYILGVEWENNWRFKLIDEGTNEKQAHSQTSEVTAYQIHHTSDFQVPYSLTIIDTPGFGDTRGINQDNEIPEKIGQLFSVQRGINTIDAVCFIVQSASARLTPTQKYIFDAILSVFGNDIANNIIALVTFADGKEPPVLEVIKAANIPCASNPDGSPLHFKFNNSVLFAKNTGVSSDEHNFDHMFWKMGEASMNRFFTHLASMQPQSMTLTKEVLQERKQLEVTVQGLQPMIRKVLATLTEIDTTKAALQDHETKMKENEDFEYEVETEQRIKNIHLDPKTFATNCSSCNYTCHYPCYLSKDEDKKKCNAMKNGLCTVCPGKCTWSVHFNMPYRWDTKRVKEKRTYQGLKRGYEAALGEKMNMENIIERLEAEYEQMQNNVVELIATVTKCLERLREVACRPDPLSTEEYIDLLIQSESQEAKPGFKQRIKELQEAREKAVLVRKIGDGFQVEKTKLEKTESETKGLFSNASTLFHQ